MHSERTKDSENPDRFATKKNFSLKTLLVGSTLVTAVIGEIGSAIRKHANNPHIDAMENARFVKDLESLNETLKHEDVSSIQELHLRYLPWGDAMRVQKKYGIPVAYFFHANGKQHDEFSSKTAENIEKALKEWATLASMNEPIDLNAPEGRNTANPIKTIRAAASMRKHLPEKHKTELPSDTIREILQNTIRRLLLDWDGKSQLNDDQLFFIAKNISGLLTDFPDHEAEQAAKDLLEKEFGIVLNKQAWSDFWQELEPEIHISRVALNDDELVPSTGDVASR